MAIYDKKEEEKKITEKGFCGWPSRKKKPSHVGTRGTIQQDADGIARRGVMPEGNRRTGKITECWYTLTAGRGTVCWYDKRQMSVPLCDAVSSAWTL
jgi:hypothetical protein